MNRLDQDAVKGSWKFGWLPVTLMIASAPLMYWGAETVPSNTADLAAWLSDRGSQRQQYEEFVTLFGEDRFVFVTWPGCSLQSPTLEQFASQLTADDVGRRFIRRVMTGHEMVEQLTSAPLQLDRDAALARLRGVLIGPNCQTTGALVLLSDAGREHQHDVIRLISEKAEDIDEIPAQELRLGGSVYEAVTIEKECDLSLRAFVLPAFLITTAIAWLCLRQPVLVAIVISVGAFCRYMSLAVLSFSGGYLDLVMIVLPVLVMVLTVSGAVHLVNYYRDAVAEHGNQSAGRRALHAAFVPCSLAVGSTAVGLLSLCISQIGPIRNFGGYSAVTLLLSLVVLLMVIPPTLDLKPFRSRNVRTNRGDTAGGEPTQLSTVATRLVDFAVVHRAFVCVFGLILTAAIGIGLTWTQTTVKLEKMFRRDSKIIQDYEWIERHIGPLISIETVIRFDTDCPFDQVKRLELLSSIQDELGGLANVGGVFSAATYCPEIPDAAGLKNAVRRKVLNRRLQKRRQQLLDEGYLAVTEEGEHWRITSRTAAIQPDDYTTSIKRIQEATDRVMQQLEPGTVEHISIVQTGILPLIDHAQKQLLRDLINSLGLAVIAICPVMIVVLRSVRAGLLAMIPNVFPILIVFGVMGWLGIAIDISSILTGSIALGIAVDDTLHVLNWYKKGRGDGLTSLQAIRFAYRRCAVAMFQTTLICGFGVLVLSLSTFVPTARFACLMCITLWMALAGDMILLPALLAGPLGRAITLRGKPARSTVY